MVQNGGKHRNRNASAGYKSNQAGDAKVSEIPPSQGRVVHHNRQVRRSSNGANAGQGCANTHQPQKANGDIRADLIGTP